MKYLISKKGIILFFLLFNAIFFFAQESKLKLYSSSLGMGILPSYDLFGGGYSISLDLSANLKSGLLSLYLNGGFEVDNKGGIILDGVGNYTEINIT